MGFVENYQVFFYQVHDFHRPLFVNKFIFYTFLELLNEL